MINFPVTGGCLCRAIRVDITRAPIMVYTCHCMDCQHITSSAFSVGVVMLDEAVQLSGKTPRMIESIADSGRTKRRYVCPDCAAWVFGEPQSGTQVKGMVRVIRGGTLDDTSWLRPSVHFSTRSKQPWIILPESDQRFDTQPSDVRQIRSSS
jgi:hypothetical protein